TSLEQAVHQMVGHPARNFLGGDLGAIDEGAALGAVGDEAAGLHFAEHGSDGGISEFGAAAEGVVDVGDSGFALLPEGLEDLQLEIAEAMHFGFGHRATVRYRGNTTT